MRAFCKRYGIEDYKFSRKMMRYASELAQVTHTGMNYFMDMPIKDFIWLYNDTAERMKKHKPKHR